MKVTTRNNNKKKYAIRVQITVERCNYLNVMIFKLINILAGGSLKYESETRNTEWYTVLFCVLFRFVFVITIANSIEQLLLILKSNYLCFIVLVLQNGFDLEFCLNGLQHNFNIVFGLHIFSYYCKSSVGFSFTGLV